MSLLLLGFFGAARAQAEFVVRIRLAVTDASGAPLETVPVGASFELRGYVQDLRMSDPDGVFAAYLDVLFDHTLVSSAGPIAFTRPYTAGQSGTVAAAIIDEVGAFCGTWGECFAAPFLGPDEYLLFTAPFQALAPGLAGFLGETADESPLHDVLLFGWNLPVCPSTAASGCVGEIQFVDTTVMITPCLAADGESAILQDDTVLESVTVETCDWIRTGPNYGVGPGGRLVLRAGNRVELWDDFSVTGGELIVEIDPSLVP